MTTIPTHLTVAEEDAWAYTRDHQELLVQAHADSAEGRIVRLAEQDLATLTGDE